MKNQKVRIIDNKTGQTAVFYKRFVLQELSRPTVSTYLPVDEPVTTMPAFSHDKLEYFFEKYGHENIILFDDIPCSEYQKAKRVFGDSYRYGKVARLANGIYARFGTAVSDKELVVRKYIERNGKIRGYFFAETFLYELGLLGECPEILQIVTNYTTRDHSRITKLNDVKVRIQRGRTFITNENATPLQVLDILLKLRYYERLCETDLIFSLARHCVSNGITKEQILSVVEFYPTYISNNVSNLTKEMENTHE